jgi:hypothetical protein
MHYQEEYSALASGVSWDDFLWAMCIVHSRSFSVSIPRTGTYIDAVSPSQKYASVFHERAKEATKIADYPAMLV